MTSYSMIADRRPLPEPQWYVVMTAAQKEAKTAENLNRAGYWSYFPFDRVRKSRKRGHRNVVEWLPRPYFSRYVFVCLRFADESIRDVEEVDGVSVVVRKKFTKEPLLVAPELMDELMEKAMVCLGSDDRKKIAGLMREIVLDTDKTLILKRDESGKRRIVRGQTQAA